MIRIKSIRLALPTLCLAILIAVTARPVQASIAIHPRLDGPDRYQTSATIAKQFSDEVVDHVVLASGQDFPDALSASVLAHQLNAPILLVNKHPHNSPDALAYIETHLSRDGKIFIIGGDGVIGAEFDSFFIDNGYAVERLGGEDRYATDRLTADALNSEPGGTVYIASGENFPDVLSVSSFASQAQAPILLVKHGSIPLAIQDYLQIQQPKQVYISGGAGVVSLEVESQIQALLPEATLTRFSGNDRYETAAQAYEQIAPYPETIYIASGSNYPDALSGAPLAAQKGDPILLINPSTPIVPDTIAAYLTQLYINGVTPSVTALGGPGVVPDEVVHNVVNLLNGQAQSPLFMIRTVDSRLVMEKSIFPITKESYFFNIDTYKDSYSGSFHSSIQDKLYNYMLNQGHQVSVHNRAVALHSGILINNCVYFQAEALRRVGFNIPNSMANVAKFSNYLTKLGFKKDTNIKSLKPGDIVFTVKNTHTYTFMGWVNPGSYDYAYIVDNQARSFGGQVYHVRKVNGVDPDLNTDPMAFFMYYQD
ncbi:cell wall-binding protein [Desulfitobacterium dichloroeliminans LMG P-21439]|uniref:Cell wall-binding protein n=1 Tax=Desulfitobacterium dichloroeliminans (strain LMG P-21439 / DCA1) TaxID=871963 RepID=L0F4G6_DESDL|nr:cell wall-binding repeat-containing protein [Desulfitobacterium dichloroeliminans]AGA67838.1 cell wall-binding protein [Desulfitobacterium dichloroeliminans LMG P-21439]